MMFNGAGAKDISTFAKHVHGWKDSRKNPMVLNPASRSRFFLGCGNIQRSSPFKAQRDPIHPLVLITFDCTYKNQRRKNPRRNVRSKLQ